MTVWSVRLSLLIYVIFLSIVLLDRHQKYWAVNRLIWTLGCSLFIVHVVSVFSFVHDWSHANALEETAQQTREVVGIEWGGGLFFNYFFTLVWIFDVGWWWLRSQSYLARHRAWNFALHGFFLFIAFNASVVFESGPLRWFGIAATLWLLGLGVFVAVSRNKRPVTNKVS